MYTIDIGPNLISLLRLYVVARYVLPAILGIVFFVGAYEATLKILDGTDWELPDISKWAWIAITIVVLIGLASIF
jgi:hypothetical protein